MSILKFYHKHKNKSHREIYNMYNNIDGYKCICGCDTEFISLSKGYNEYCSIKCKDINTDYTYDNIIKKLMSDGKFFAKQFIKIKEYYNLTPKDLYLIKFPNSNICEVCNSETKFVNYNKGFSRTCSYKCGSSLPRRKLSDEDKIIASEKRQKTCLEKYGVTSNLCLIDNSGRNNVIFRPGVLEKKNDTMMERYGVIHPLQNTEIMNKMVNTNLTNYGVKYILEDAYKKINGMLAKYNVVHAMHSTELVNKFKFSREQNTSDRREDDNISGFVYVLDFYNISKIKIGLTNNVKTRLKELYSSFGEFNIIYLLETNSCYKLEKFLHKQFNNHRLPELVGCGKTEFFDNIISENIRLDNIPEEIQIKVLIDRE